ncbi:MAG: hypothetical protein ACR2M1_00035, partial [Gemmatimonadaceae bacterium]
MPDRSKPNDPSESPEPNRALGSEPQPEPRALDATPPPSSSRPEITTPDALNDESVVELSLRPQRLAEFIGQPKV